MRHVTGVSNDNDNTYLIDRSSKNVHYSSAFSQYVFLATLSLLIVSGSAAESLRPESSEHRRICEDSQEVRAHAISYRPCGLCP